MIKEKRRYPEKLPVTLTDSELLTFAREQSAALHRRDKLEESFKTIKAQSNADIGREEETVHKCASIISTGVEWRNVECAEMHDYERSIVSIVRLDTGEVVRERVMSQEDRQFDIEKDAALDEILAMFDSDAAKASTVIEITVKLLEARDTARTVAGDKYAENVDPLIEILKTASAERNPAAVVLDVCRGASDTVRMWWFAALVEFLTEGEMDAQAAIKKVLKKYFAKK